MISNQAQKIRATLVSDSLDEDYLVRRLDWENAARQVSVPTGIHVRTVVIGGVSCMLHSASSQFPGNEVILYIHGGGLVEGSIHTSREWCARLSKACDLTVVSIDYSLAPEHPYPAALNDVLNVYSALDDAWPACVVKSFGADSSGCSLLLATLFKLRDAESEMPQCLFLLSPSIDFLFSGESVETNKLNDPMVSKAVLEHYAKLYAGENSLNDAMISPLYGNFERIPPMLIQVDADEVLLDDSVRLKALAEQAQCSVELVISEGLWHVWPTFGDFPEAKEATKRIVRHIRHEWQ